MPTFWQMRSGEQHVTVTVHEMVPALDAGAVLGTTECAIDEHDTLDRVMTRTFLPWGGRGYFRLLPDPVFRAGARRILDSGRPYVFYIHPWEIDPGQPRPNGLSPLSRFRHYVGLERCEARLARLLTDFEWMTMGELVDRSRVAVGVSYEASN